MSRSEHQQTVPNAALPSFAAKREDLMSSRKPQPLAAGYASASDPVDEKVWCDLLAAFDDANIYQTWSYAEVIAGHRNMSHLVLRLDGRVVAAAQARIAKLPLLNIGVAYVHWGPLWRTKAGTPDPEQFRQAIRALRNEFVCRRGLVLRIFPVAFDSVGACFSQILEEEGFSSMTNGTPGRTILMDLSAPLTDLREGMNAHWKRELKVAEKGKLEIVEGSDELIFCQFIEVYKEMVSRKKFVEPNDINQFRLIQARLPESLKMRVMLGRADSKVCAGVIYSAIGDSAIYLFGATSNSGMKSRGSYLLQWKLVEAIKQRGTAVYNLNGINPTVNPGTYKFKNDLAGRNGKDVYYLGRFDAYASATSRLCVRVGDVVRTGPMKIKRLVKVAGGIKKEPLAPARTTGGMLLDKPLVADSRRAGQR